MKKYNLYILGIYILLVPLMLLFYPNLMLYILIWIIFGVAYLVFKKTRIKLFYAVLFAIPEEIIFRGIIQYQLYAYFEAANLSVLLSALIFGLVHLPNGAMGWHPRLWNWRLCGLAFLGGLLLGLSFVVTGDLLIPIILHITFLLFLSKTYRLGN